MKRAFLKAALVLAVVVVASSPMAQAAQEVDVCTPAPVITTLPYADTGTTCGATNDITNYGGTCATALPFPYPGPDVIYAFATTAGNSVTISASLTGSTGDLALFVIDTTCATAANCNHQSQDAIGVGAGPENIAAASYSDGNHYIYVDSYYGAPAPASCGTYTLNVTGTLPIALDSFSIE